MLEDNSNESSKAAEYKVKFEAIPTIEDVGEICSICALPFEEFIQEFFCGTAIVTVLHSKYPCSPSGPSSLPIPDCLNPPNGV